MLVHTVFFWLKPGLTGEQIADFHRGVESLGRIRSVEKVYIGRPAGVPDRPVVDKSFALGLTVICKSVAAHDEYQSDPIHLKFIDDCKQYWSRVQVYDAE